MNGWLVWLVWLRVRARVSGPAVEQASKPSWGWVGSWAPGEPQRHTITRGLTSLLGRICRGKKISAVGWASHA